MTTNYSGAGYFRASCEGGDEEGYKLRNSQNNGAKSIMPRIRLLIPDPIKLDPCMHGDDVESKRCDLLMSYFVLVGNRLA